MRNIPSIAGRIVLLGLFLLTGRAASASVIFPQEESSVANLAKPPSGVMVRWDGNASGVMISPNHLITTKHQGGGVGTHVWVNGVEYVVASEVANSDADIRVDRLVTLGGQNANIRDYVSVSQNYSEVGQTVTIGGFGRQRGSALLTPSGTVYGYAWNDSDNSLLNWGSQFIDDFTANGYLTAHFEAPGQAGHVTCEAGVAEYDSGGGWFINNGNKWSVVGLTHGVERFGSTWFGTNTDPSLPHADLMDAVRVSVYFEWILAVAMQSETLRVPGDGNGDGRVDGLDLSYILAAWHRSAEWPYGDYNRDKYVDGLDLSVLLANWSYTNQSPATNALPEPATIVILFAGGLSLIVRRHRAAISSDIEAKS